MEKIKEFMSNPKKTAILGLVGSVLMWLLYYLFELFEHWGRLDFDLGCLFYILCHYDLDYLFYNFYIIGLIIYFIIVLMRIFKKKGNIKVANYILIVCYIITLLHKIFFYVEYYEFLALALIVSILYFFKILLGMKNFVNNKVFALSVICYALINYTLPIDNCGVYLGYILIVPYFYNYYKLLKNENIKK